MLSLFGTPRDPEFGSLSEPGYGRNGTMDAFNFVLVSLAGWMNRQAAARDRIPVGGDDWNPEGISPCPLLEPSDRHAADRPIIEPGAMRNTLVSLFSECRTGKLKLCKLQLALEPGGDLSDVVRSNKCDDTWFDPDPWGRCRLGTSAIHPTCRQCSATDRLGRPVEALVLAK
jgi:hypothetical protein